MYGLVRSTRLRVGSEMLNPKLTDANIAASGEAVTFAASLMMMCLICARVLTYATIGTVFIDITLDEFYQYENLQDSALRHIMETVFTQFLHKSR